jgi:catalase
MHSPGAVDAFVSYAEKVDGAKIRTRSESFSAHFSQATQFWNSMSDWEHITSPMLSPLNSTGSKVRRFGTT